MNLSTIFTNFLDSNIFKQNEINEEEEEGERKMKANKKNDMKKEYEVRCYHTAANRFRTIKSNIINHYSIRC